VFSRGSSAVWRRGFFRPLPRLIQDPSRCPEGSEELFLRIGDPRQPRLQLGMRIMQYSLLWQDSWKLKPSFTLTYAFWNFESNG